MSDKKIQIEIKPAKFNPDHNSTESSPFRPRQRLSRSPPLTPIPHRKLSTSSVPEKLLFSTRRVTRSQAKEENSKESSRESINSHDESSAEDEEEKEEYSENYEEESKEEENTIITQEATKEQEEKEDLENQETIKTNRRESEKQGRMDSTISDAMATNKKPAKPTFISPSTFHPSKGNATNFINNYERTAIANGWDNALKIAYFGSFLDGGANLWYRLYTTDPKNSQKEWSHITEDFLGEFDDPDRKDSLLAKVENRKQGRKESVRDFFYELKTAFFEYDPELDAEEFIKFFRKGLTPEAAYHYHWLTHPPNKPPTTLQDVKHLATRIDKAPRQEQAEERQTSPPWRPQPSTSYGQDSQGYRNRN